MKLVELQKFKHTLFHDKLDPAHDKRSTLWLKELAELPRSRRAFTTQKDFLWHHLQALSPTASNRDTPITPAAIGKASHVIYCPSFACKRSFIK